MLQQGAIVFGWMTFTTALAVTAPFGDSSTLGYLLAAFACTLTLPAAFLIAWRRSPRWRERVMTIDLAPVVLLETGRVLGLAMLLLYSVHRLSGWFAFPGGGIDVFIGVTALTMAYVVLPMRPFPSRLFRAWNVFGLLDFVVGWALVFLFSPTVLGVFAGSDPASTTEGFIRFPLSFIPMFGVPFSACIHLIALFQTRGGRVPPVNPLFHEAMPEVQALR